MKKLKISKKSYCKNYENNKYFFVFVFFNMNSTLIELLKTILEDNFTIFKIESKLNLAIFYLEFDIENYVSEKQELFEFFKEENFKFVLLAIYNKSNFIQLSFFESIISFDLEQDNNSLNSEETEEDETEEDNELENFEIYTEIFYINFIKVILNEIYIKKIIYFTINAFILNTNFFKYICLRSIKQHLN